MKATAHRCIPVAPSSFSKARNPVQPISPSSGGRANDIIWMDAEQSVRSGWPSRTNMPPPDKKDRAQGPVSPTGKSMSLPGHATGRASCDVGRPTWIGRSRHVVLCHQTVAPAFGNQQPRVGWIGFNLLPQAINMGFQRVRCDTRIVTPNLVQQHIARHNAIGRPI